MRNRLSSSTLEAINPHDLARVANSVPTTERPDKNVASKIKLSHYAFDTLKRIWIVVRGALAAASRLYKRGTSISQPLRQKGRREVPGQVLYAWHIRCLLVLLDAQPPAGKTMLGPSFNAPEQDWY